MTNSKWKDIFTASKTDKELILKIFKELSQIKISARKSQRPQKKIINNHEESVSLQQRSPRAQQTHEKMLTLISN